MPMWSAKVRVKKNNTAIAWFNLTGNCIAAPVQPGIYIKVVGEKTIKTIIR